MEGENSTKTVKIDIHVSDKGKIKWQDGERESLLEGNSKAESWIDQIKRTHRSGKHKEQKMSAFVCIYRVPEWIKKTKREAYVPMVVCLGPYHHEEEHQLTAMDDYKLQAVDRTLERIPGMTTEELVAKVRELEIEIRDCYEDSVNEWDGDTLAWMMTMDACFILEFLRMDLPNSSHIFHPQRRDNIKRREIILDIMKLENQIPLCVLKNILELELKDCRRVPAFLAEQLVGIGDYFQGYPFLLKENVKTAKDVKNVSRRVIERCILEGECHLLNLSRQVIAKFLSNSGSDSGIGSGMGKTNRMAVHGWLRPSSAVDESLISSAAKLQRAGIKLKPSTDGKFFFKGRCFGCSTLFLPKIIVEDGTEIFLRNLVAFEDCQSQQNSQIQRKISNNLCIMNNLIHSKEDVELFQRANIIKKWLVTDDKVAQMFHDLCSGITHKDDFEHVMRKINEHHKHQLNVRIIQYIILIMVAVFLLVMGLL